jgi:hypothetical protein
MIDINCFFGPLVNSKIQLTKITDLKPMMKVGIKKIFITSTDAVQYDVKEGNKVIVNLAKQHNYLFPVVVFPLDIGHIGDVQSFLDIATSLCRLQITNESEIDQQDRTLHRFLAGFSDIGRGVLVAYSPNIHYLIDCIAKKYPKLSFILTGINYPQIRTAFSLFERHKNVFMETSYFQLYRGLEYLIKKIGAERILFGTNSPFYTYQSAVLKLKKADISQKDNRLIANDNIIRILGGCK